MKLKSSHSHWMSEVRFCLCIPVCTGHDDTGLSPRVWGTFSHVFCDRYTVLFYHSNKEKEIHGE